MEIMHYNHNTVQMQYSSQSHGYMQNVKGTLMSAP